MAPSSSPPSKSKTFDMNKVIALALVALLGGGGASFSQMLQLPDREELRQMIKDETSGAVQKAAEDAADKAIQRALERQHISESRIDSRIDELYRRVDRMAPYAAAAAPLVRSSLPARQKYREAKEEVRRGEDPFTKDLDR